MILSKILKHSVIPATTPPAHAPASQARDTISHDPPAYHNMTGSLPHSPSPDHSSCFLLSLKGLCSIENLLKYCLSTVWLCQALYIYGNTWLYIYCVWFSVYEVFVICFFQFLPLSNLLHLLCMTMFGPRFPDYCCCPVYMVVRLNFDYFVLYTFAWIY